MDLIFRVAGILTSGLFKSRIPVTLSPLSGLVAKVFVGLPPQELKMALDFTSNESVLYRDTQCPFQVHCFDPIIAFIGWYDPDQMVEDLWFNKHSLFPMVSFNSWNPEENARFRDVAGTIGFGPDSYPFQNFRLAILVSGDGEIVFEKAQAQNSHENSNNWISSQSATSWRWRGMLNGEEVDINLDFSYGNTFCVPERFRLSHPLVLRLTEDFALDDFAVSFRSVEYVSVGLNIFEHIEKIMLDFGTRRLSFVPRSTLFRPLLPKPELLLFELPEFHLNNQAIVARQSENGNLVLRGLNPIRETSSEGSEGYCWRFYRSISVNENFVPNTSFFVGPFKRVDAEKVSDPTNLVQWKLVRANNPDINKKTVAEISIAHEPEFVDVCEWVVRDLSDFDIPGPVLADASWEIDCVICMNSILKGQSIQAMRVCSHVFHAECSVKWFHVKAECPVCRSKLVKRPLWRSCIIC